MNRGPLQRVHCGEVWRASRCGICGWFVWDEGVGLGAGLVTMWIQNMWPIFENLIYTSIKTAKGSWFELHVLEICDVPSLSKHHFLRPEIFRHLDPTPGRHRHRAPKVFRFLRLTRTVQVGICGDTTVLDASMHIGMPIWTIREVFGSVFCAFMCFLKSAKTWKRGLFWLMGSGECLSL